MEAALGVLGWSPAVFWQSTPHEFWAAWEGWCKVNGHSDDKDESLEPEEHDYLKQWMKREREHEEAGLVRSKNPREISHVEILNLTTGD
jgi:hypothetical protein